MPSERSKSISSASTIGSTEQINDDAGYDRLPSQDLPRETSSSGHSESNKSSQRLGGENERTSGATLTELNVAGLEQIDDESTGPPIPLEMTRYGPTTVYDSECPPSAGKRKVALEQVEDDADAPLHPSTVAVSYEDADVSSKKNISPLKQKNAEAKSASTTDKVRNLPSQVNNMVLQPELGRDKSDGVHANGLVDEFDADSVAATRSSVHTRSNDDNVAVTRATAHTRSSESDATLRASVHERIDIEEGDPVIPDAYLVDNHDVVIGTPLEDQPIPMCRQRRARILLAAVFALVVLLSIALGASLSSDPAVVTIVVQQSSSPSFSLDPSNMPSPIPTTAPSSSSSNTPSLSPSTSLSMNPSPLPSMSVHPSLSPTSSMQLKVLFEADCDNCDPQIALHGDTVVLTRNNIDIQFFEATAEGFQLVNKIDIGYKPTAVDIHTDQQTLFVDTDVVVIGSYFENDSTGAAYVYEKGQSGIWYEAARLDPSATDISQVAAPGWAAISEGTLFGRAVAINDEYNLIVVGADDDGAEGQGAVYIYRRSSYGSTWYEEAKLIPPGGSTAESAEGFGYTVSSKGTTVVVGDIAYGAQKEGAVFVYEFSTGWVGVYPIEEFSDAIKLIGTVMNTDCKNFFGQIVRLTHDEDLLVTCSGNNIVYYYEKQGAEREYVLKQNIPFEHSIMSIEVDENVMVVGETGKFDNVHVFARKDHAWEEINQIDGPVSDDSFGRKVALHGNTTLIASQSNVYQLEHHFSS